MEGREVELVRLGLKLCKQQHSTTQPRHDDHNAIPMHVPSIAILAILLTAIPLATGSPLRGSFNPCGSFKQKDACQNPECVWCRSMAVPSSCLPLEKAKLLPKDVFFCEFPTGAAECLPFSTATADAGYNDIYEGWYDVQGCGRCNDYCRWVGNDGDGGDPALNIRHGVSWWSCRAAGSNENYNQFDKPHAPRYAGTPWKNFAKCSGQGAKASTDTILKNMLTQAEKKRR